MNSKMLGADPEQLRDLAKLFSDSSATLDSSAGSLHPAVMQARWHGPDAERLRHDWSSRMRPQIVSAGNLLRAASQQLDAQAMEQQNASSGNADGGGGFNIVPIGNGRDHKYLICPVPETTRNELEDMSNRSPAEVQAWWHGLTPEQQADLIGGVDDNLVPYAYYLASLEGRLPPEAWAAAQARLLENAKGSIPMYVLKTMYGIEGQALWTHMGAHIGTQYTLNADGTVSLKVSGDIGGGVNTPGGSVSAGATLSGEMSKTYTFNSLEEAVAAGDQMLADLPPDDFGDAGNAVSNPGGYLEGLLDKAAEDNGSSKSHLSAKGTLTLEVGAKTADDSASGKAQLDLAYEKNLTDNTSTASVTGQIGGELNLGGDMSLSGNGEAAIKLHLDSEGDVQKLTIKVQGTVAGGELLGNDPGTSPLSLPDPSATKNGPSVESTAGIQGSAHMDLFVTPENAALVDSYLRNIATVNAAGAAADLEQILDASAVTVQTNSVASVEANIVDFEAPGASLKIGGTTDTTINAGTFHKAPYDNGFQVIEGRNRYTPSEQ